MISLSDVHYGNIEISTTMDHLAFTPYCFVDPCGKVFDLYGRL